MTMTAKKSVIFLLYVILFAGEAVFVMADKGLMLDVSLSG